MATIASAFMEGFSAGNEIIASGHRSRARAAAIEQYGDIARDPALFSALQQYDLADSQEQRAQQGFESQEQRFAAQEGRLSAQEGRLDAAEGRAAASFGYQVEDREQERQRSAVIGLVQGLRQARDTGGDVGEAFDRSHDLLMQLGVDPGDLAAMRQAVVDNPAVLDEYLRTLTGNDTPSTATGAAGGLTAYQQHTIAQAQADQLDASRRANAFIDRAEAIYDRLDEIGAIRSENASGVLDNFGRYLSSSGPGQVAGTFWSTEAQRLREEIQGIIPQLLIQLKDSMGPGTARMFDTETDMRFWRQALTDPRTSIEANKANLDNLRIFLATPEEFERRWGVDIDTATDDELKSLILSGETPPPPPSPPPTGQGPSSSELQLARAILASGTATDDERRYAEWVLSQQPPGTQ